MVEWACRSLLYHAQEQLHQFLRNFPNRFLAALMRLLIFPRGLTYSLPSDRLGGDIGELVMNPTATRERLSAHIYKTPEPHNPLGKLQEALQLATLAEPLEKRIRVDGVKTGPRHRPRPAGADRAGARPGNPHRGRGGGAA